MKINTNNNFTALHTMKKTQAGKAEAFNDNVTLGQTENFQDMKSLRSMAQELGNVKSDFVGDVLKGFMIAGGIIAGTGVIAGTAGGFIGHSVGGPVGAVIGAIGGAAVGVGGLALASKIME